MEKKEWRENQNIFDDDTSPESVIAAAQDLLSSDYSQANHIIVPDKRFQQISQNMETGTNQKLIMYKNQNYV